MLSQKYVFKINSSRLRRAKWNLNLDLLDAFRNEEVIPLSSSQCLRWIDSITGEGYNEDEKLVIEYDYILKDTSINLKYFIAKIVWNIFGFYNGSKLLIKIKH